MDVEGHEVEILSSMIHSISTNLYSPHILFETHLSRYNDSHNLKEILTKYYNCGYIASLIGSSQTLGNINIEKFGYLNIKTIFSDGCERKVYKNIALNHLIDLIHNQGGIRSVLLQRKII
jgi:hypothetical protein